MLSLFASSLSTEVSLPILAVLGFVSIFASYVLFSPRQVLSPSSPKQISDQYPVLGALRYFSTQWDFYRDAIAESKTGNFSFYLGKYGVIGFSGRQARKDYFESKALSLHEGSSLSPQIPTPPQTIRGGKAIQDTSDFAEYFNRRINRMLSRENFGRCVPAMIRDTQSRLLEFGDSGMTDPFISIHSLVFQLTVRNVGCNDIADNRALLDTTRGIYETMESSYNPSIIVLPWIVKLFTPSFINQSIAGARLYFILKGIVDKRKKIGLRENDTLQYLMDQGDDIGKMIGFIIGALFAGVVNSGINSGWLLCYLATNPRWMAEVRKEVENAAAKYSTGFPDETTSLSDQLANLPVEAWEIEFPMLDLCLRETIRVQGQGVFQRRNVSGTDINIGGEVVPNGAFALYHVADTHRDETIYKDPETWDPARYLPDRAEGLNKLDYIGWGIGRHPCPGMRFAKLEMNMIVAFFVATYNYNLVDKQGSPIPQPPPLNRNNKAASKPDTTILLKYERR
ncbi:cytochrome P450 [Rhexocercosporidium sp. MPI-PUGE-AT-0058]|nr:cytochrome P450 [Rhexocercosporidium sp. MPI-PUGE-AT-0058]